MDKSYISKEPGSFIPQLHSVINSEQTSLMENHDPVQIVKTKNVFVTRSLLVRKFSGIVDACLFPSMERKTRKKLSLYSALSLFKHRLRFWKNEDYYFVFNVWATGYYHWITEVAIKFVLFERELQSGVIIIPENCPHFISEFLLIMGISNTRQMKGNCYIKKLNIITNPVSGHPDPAHLEAFRSRVLLEVKEDGKKFEKIYVSRRKANQRKVLNEDQVTEKLKAGGYYIAELEKLPWAEQVNIFRHCRKLVAVHGAGLSNALFMPRGSAMIEIYPKSRGDEPGTNPCYQTLCGDLGHHHVYLFAAREKPDSKPDFHSDNMVVDLAGLDALVR